MIGCKRPSSDEREPSGSAAGFHLKTCSAAEPLGSRSRAAIICAPVLLFPLAHFGPHADDVFAPSGPTNFHELLRTWALEPGITIPLALSGWLYVLGLSRMWRDSNIGR